jgi:hypothetical protein
MDPKNVLLQPEYQRFFRWNGRSLSLRADAPEEVVRAWQAVGRRCQRRRRRLLWLRLPIHFAA